MKKIILSIAALLIILCSACTHVEDQKNGDQKNGVKLIVQQDSIKIYRFYDCGRIGYFTSTGVISIK